MKKYLLLIGLLLMSCSSNIQENGTIRYELNNDNKTASVILSSSFNLKKLEIPSSISQDNITYTVNSISVNSFKGNGNIEEVIIPDSITSIGYDAFRECNNLKKVRMSNNVISLSDHLFADCINLSSFEGGEKVENIYKGTFQNTHLESITFNNLKLVSVDSFFNNKYLKDVTLLGEYTSLSGSSFERCPALENVNLSSSVNKIDNYAFKDCSLLTNFDFTNITSIGKYAFENCNIAEVKTSSLSLSEGSFASCKNLKTIDFTTKEIPYKCFYDSVSLSSFSLKDYQKIGSYAFYQTGIKNINFINTLEVISSSSFENSSLESFTFTNDSKLKNISSRAFYNSKLSGEISLPTNLKTIYNEAFLHTNISKVNLSSSTEYDNNVFESNVEIISYK